jgi:hypothetical protein
MISRNAHLVHQNWYRISFTLYKISSVDSNFFSIVPSEDGRCCKALLPHIVDTPRKSGDIVAFPPEGKFSL